MRAEPFLFMIAVATVAMTGCATKTDNLSGVSREARQAISEAAVAKYPGSPTTSRDVQTMAINHPEKAFIEIHNYGTQSIPPSTVWVNGTFLRRIDGIAPKSYTSVKHAELLEAGPAATYDLKSLNQSVAKVEIQTPRGLFMVNGPTVKHD